MTKTAARAKKPAERQTAVAAADLPRWDLTHLYPAPDSKALKDDLAEVEAEALAFAKRYTGKLAKLSGKALGQALARYEAMQDVLGRVMSFAQLTYAGNVTDPETARFYQTMQERVTEISTHLLFFTLEINKLDERTLKAQLKDPGLAHYKPWLRDVRTFRPHQLSDDVEKILHEKSVAGRAAWNRLFDETMARLRFPIDGKLLTSAEALHLLSDRNRQVRKKAALSLGKVLGENVATFALVTNTLAKDKEIEDRWRKFARPDSSRNLSNYVEDAVVDALVASVKSSYPKLAHRYYKLKAHWFGVAQLDYWDRNAPLPDAEDRSIPWTEAKSTVLTSYRAFSPDLATVAERFFDERWIDAGVRPGKEPG